MDNDSEEERDTTSRRVTGAESQGRLRGASSSKRTLDDGVYGGTPPKRQYSDTVSSQNLRGEGC